jgi:hypothetical protein
MVRVTARLLGITSGLAEKNQLDILLTYFNLCKGDKNHSNDSLCKAAYHADFTPIGLWTKAAYHRGGV